MKVRFPGYAPEKRGSRTLHRVRVKGEKTRRISIPVGPDHPAFSEHYHAARRGVAKPAPRAKATKPMSLDALVDAYLIALEQDVKAGIRSPLTLKQRADLLRKACDFPDDTGQGRMGDLHCDLPPAAIRHIMSKWGARTGNADNTRKALSAAYDRLEWVAANPCKGIKAVHRNRGGAKAWSTDDLQKFLATHPEGTPARVWAMLALWTGARLADLAILGRRHEVKRDGITWLEWQPDKTGSTFTAVPMAPQLVETIRANGVIGKTYILTTQGQPYADGLSLAEAVRGWTATAGLTRRSSHGLRKALGGLLASYGATEHQIMAVLSHASPATASIYTKTAGRSRMAAEAMKAIGGFRIG